MDEVLLKSTCRIEVGNAFSKVFIVKFFDRVVITGHLTVVVFRIASFCNSSSLVHKKCPLSCCQVAAKEISKPDRV